MLKNLQLGPRFIILLSIIFILGITTSGIALWKTLQQRSQQEVVTRAQEIIGAMNAVRDYTSKVIAPKFEGHRDSDENFIPETIPAFAARNIFDRFIDNNPQFASFQYKEAAPNPRNLLNGTDDFELALLQQFKEDPVLNELSGYRELAQERFYYIAHPMIMQDSRCLACHGTYQEAPTELTIHYGSSGFGWQLGSIIALQIIYVPAENVFRSAQNSFFLVMAIFSLVFGTVIFTINQLIKNQIIHPIEAIEILVIRMEAESVQPHDLDDPQFQKVAVRNDELGLLARIFDHMARGIIARTNKLKNELVTLRIEIDEIQRRHQVLKITETDFFKDLKARANEQRSLNSKNEEEGTGDEQ